MKILLFLPLLALSIFLSACSPPAEEETPVAEPETSEPAAETAAEPETSEPAVNPEGGETPATESSSPAETTPAEPAAENGEATPVASDAAAPEPAATANPVVTLSTSMGDIKLELFAKEAPQTVANFLSYAKEGYYKDTVFHRVIGGFMVQGGGFALEGDGSIKQKDTKDPVQNEAKNGVKNARGTVAMARTSDPHSATSQFFINHADNANLDYPSFDGWGYTVFGKVIEGLDVVDAIAEVETGTQSLVTKVGPRPMDDVPSSPIVIQSVTVSE